MKSKHIPIRTCVICGKKNNKKNMFRIVEEKFDKNQKSNGRGKYICQDIKCLQDATKAKKKKLSLNVIEDMIKEINKNNI